MAKLNKILVPTDFSEVGNGAVDYAINLAKTNRAKITLMTVIGDLPQTAEEKMMLRVSVESVEADNKKQIDTATVKLKQLVKPAVAKSLRVQFLVRDGKPFVEILRAANEIRADLIVMSSHGHSRLAEIFLGSTTDRVVQKAPCSVLVVRATQYELKLP
jgi:nucleotide-binding universal stress UspA family protein